MQRFIVSLLGIAAVVFVFFQFVNAQPDIDLDLTTPDQTQAQPSVPAEEPTADQPAAETPVETPSEAPVEAAPAGGIDTVQVTPVQRIPDYNRKAQFTPGGKGDNWPDVDGNGCETRDDILARDLTNVVKRDACVIASGTLADPYTGKRIDFVKDIYTNGKKTGGDSMSVQIDHVVSLKSAWQSGAHTWTQEQRVAFANDPANLIASDGPTNSSKGAKSAAQWMPSTAGNAAYDCTYAIKYVDVLVKYNLTASPKDISVLRAGLATCS